MTTLKRIITPLIVTLLTISTLEMAGHSWAPNLLGFITPAEARVGRPLTPVSVAGVARRTVRRCATGVYNC